MADLDLSSSIELLSGGGYNNNDDQHSMVSCDTAELLRTPSPCVVESDQEAEPAETGNACAEARGGSTEEKAEEQQGEQYQWADIPATSTPKKQKASDNPQILEGTFKGIAYHRDRTRVGLYHFSSLKNNQ